MDYIKPADQGCKSPKNHECEMIFLRSVFPQFQSWFLAGFFLYTYDLEYTCTGTVNLLIYFWHCYLNESIEQFRCLLMKVNGLPCHKLLLKY